MANNFNNMGMITCTLLISSISGYRYINNMYSGATRPPHGYYGSTMPQGWKPDVDVRDECGWPSNMFGPECMCFPVDEICESIGGDLIFPDNWPCCILDGVQFPHGCLDRVLSDATFNQVCHFSFCVNILETVVKCNI